jgi:outer membrane protein OmpA-like peptidoglycan-associated protein
MKTVEELNITSDAMTETAGARRVASVWLAIGFLPAAAAGLAISPAHASAIVPLCPGLTIVTAINGSEGDYESIKTVESMDAAGLHLRYSSERMVFDWLSAEPPKLKKTVTLRTVRREDLESAFLYLQQFDEQLPETVPETTAIGFSKELLRKLKTDGSADLGIFNAFSSDNLVLDRDQHPNVYDYQMITTVTRTKASEHIKVTVNDREVELPAIKVEGDFFGDQSEFFVLDDADNPLMLKFRVGIDAISPLTADEIEERKAIGLPAAIGPDRDVLQVVKIEFPCMAEDARTEPPGGAGSPPPAGGGDAKPAATAALEREIADHGRADVQTIFFSLNSAELRPESDAALITISDLLTRQPGWRISIEGHTDSQADDAYNLDLSKRRAAAVKAALVQRFAIAADRLATDGFGETRPIADNQTLQGRARNRRVELVRLP